MKFLRFDRWLALPLLALYSGAFYRHVYHHWRWRCMAYYALLILATTLILSIGIHRHVKHHYEAVMEQWAQTLPTLTIHQGQAKIQPPGLYFVGALGTWKVGVFAVDHSYDFQHNNQLFMVAQKGVWIRSLTTGAPTFYAYPKDHDQIYDTKVYEDLAHHSPMAHKIIRGFTVGYCIAFAVFSYFGLWILNLLYTTISKRFSEITRQKHDFWSLYYANLVGMTAPLLVTAVCYACFGLHFWLICFYFVSFFVYNVFINISTAHRAGRK